MRRIGIVFLLFLLLPLLATATNYAPYLDFSLLTHWDSKVKQLEPESLVEFKRLAGTQCLRLGFIVQDKHSRACDPAWGGYHAYSTDRGWGLVDINQFRGEGGSVTLSFGGEAGLYLSQTARSSTELASVYQSVIDRYQIYSVDFDIEEMHLTDHAAIERQMSALSSLQTHYHLMGKSLKISFTLPALPNGMEEPALNVIKTAIAHHVDISTVNLMAMDYNSMTSNPNKMGTYATEVAVSVHQQLQTLYPDKSDNAIWHMIGVTPMIGMNDAYPERFSQADAAMLVRFAKQHHLGLLSNWALNRDKPCVRRAASEFCSGSFRGYKMQTRAYQFAQTFGRV